MWHIGYISCKMCAIARVYLILVVHIHTSRSTNIQPLLEKIGNPGTRVTVSLNNRNITEIEDNAFKLFNKLSLVQLQKNRISNISHSAFTGTRIRQLFLMHNRLTCIPDLHSISHSLYRLYVDYNKLGECHFGTQTCNGSYALKELSLRRNDLTQLPWIVFCANDLTVLSLGDNKFKTLPDLFSLGILSSVLSCRVLTVFNNPLTCVCDVSWLKKWEEEIVFPFCKRRILSKATRCNSGEFKERLWRSLTLEELTAYCSPTTTAGE